MSAQPYKGLFICSDFDGTLAVKTKVSQENLDAICEFEEKGGRFTLCTGRFHTILEIEQVPLTLHTPMICLNGAMIYDLAKQQILFEGHTDGTAMLPAVRQLLQEADDLKRVTIMPAGEFRSYHTELPVPTEEILATVGRSLYKMVIVCHKRETEEDTLARSLVLRERLAELLGPGYTVGRSWNVGL